MSRAEAPSPRTGGAVRALVAALAVTTSGPLPLLLAGTLAVQLRGDVGITERHLGTAVTAYFLGSSILSPLAGSLTDRLGWPRAMRLGALGSASAMLLTAAFATSFTTFLPLFLVGCCGHALANPAGNVALAREVPIARRGLMFGVKQTANPIANLFAGAAVPVLALTVGWRWAFAAAAVFPLAGWLASRGFVDTRARTPPPAAPGAGGVPPPGGDGDATDTRLLPIIALSAAGGLATLGASSLGTFLVLSAVDSGVPEGTAGTFVGVAAVVGICSRVLSGWWVDRAGSSGIRPVALLLLVGSAGYLLLATGRPGLVLPAAIVAFGAGWGWPGLFNFGIVHHYSTGAGRITGRIQIGMMLGGVVGPVTFSVLATSHGYGTAWEVTALATLVGAGVSAYAAHALDHGTRTAPRPAGAVRLGAGT